MRNRIDLKNVVAVFVIIASFVIAVGLALVSNSRESYWVASHDLTPGHIIEGQDFVESKGAFAANINGYLKSSQSPVGLSISKYLASGEFLHQSALLVSALIDLKLFSFAVAAADLPDAIQVGDAINIYQVINENSDGTLVPSQLVIEEVYVVAVNRKSQNIGGSAIVTVAIPSEFVERALNATRKGRMVVIANHG